MKQNLETNAIHWFKMRLAYLYCSAHKTGTGESIFESKTNITFKTYSFFPLLFTTSLLFQQHSSAPKGLNITVIVPTAEDQMSQSHFEWENVIHPPRLSCVGLYDNSY